MTMVVRLVQRGPLRNRDIGRSCQEYFPYHFIQNTLGK
jgi:hypothetical protein